MENVKIQNQFGKFLNQYEWDYFATLSTSYSLSLASGRRAMERLTEHLNKNYGGCSIFWAIEPFDLKEGYHIHALVKLNNEVIKSDYLAKQSLTKAWQIVTAGSSNILKQHRLHLRKYKPKLGGNYYLSKYISKYNSDYDFYFSKNILN